MSTDAYIAVGNQGPEGTAYRVIGVHFGYGVGPCLLQNYFDYEDAKALVGLGDLASVGGYLVPQSEGHSWREPLPNTTVAYHRDRGDPIHRTSARSFGSIGSLLKEHLHAKLYVFEDGAWYQSVGGEALVRLSVVVYGSRIDFSTKHAVEKLLSDSDDTPLVDYEISASGLFVYDEVLAIDIAKLLGNADRLELPHGESFWFWAI